MPKQPLRLVAAIAICSILDNDQTDALRYALDLKRIARKFVARCRIACRIFLIILLLLCTLRHIVFRNTYFMLPIKH